MYSFTYKYPCYVRCPDIHLTTLAWLLLSPLLEMHFVDVLSLTLSFLGIYGLILSLRYLIPCCFIPSLSAHLNATQQLLDHAEATNALPLGSEYRTLLDLYDPYHIDRLSPHTLMHGYRSANQFAAMRMESNLAWWPFQQLRLAIQRGLTFRLYILYYRIKGIKSRLEVCQIPLLIHHTPAECIPARD